MPVENGKLNIGEGSFVIEVDRVGKANLPDACGISELISNAILRKGNAAKGLISVGIVGEEDIGIVVSFMKKALSKNSRKQEEFEYRAVNSMISRLEALFDDEVEDKRLPKDDASGIQRHFRSGEKWRDEGFTQRDVDDDDF